MSKEKLIEENKRLKKQLKYIRSGEYYNQLRFERDMLQKVVDNGEVPAEDKEFIDMTHRNTELLEENEDLKFKLEYEKENKMMYKDYGDCWHGYWNELKEWLSKENQKRPYVNIDELLFKIEEIEEGKNE